MQFKIKSDFERPSVGFSSAVSNAVKGPFWWHNGGLFLPRPCQRVTLFFSFCVPLLFPVSERVFVCVHASLRAADLE